MYPYQMKQTPFRKHLERERQQMLAAGMSEADIYRLHFGEENENGRGGDYGVWLSERKHLRPDRKYSPGVPVAIDTIDPDSARISDGKSGLEDIEFEIDLKAAMNTLTELQRLCFIQVELRDRTQKAVADELKISQQMVDKHIKAAKKKLKVFFVGRL
jgi:RNA polymerase sigma factor (sigma-70 family)